MIDTFEAILELKEPNRRAGCKARSAVIGNSTMVQSVLSALVLCLVITSRAAITHAQDGAPVGMKTTTDSSSWSLMERGSSAAPYLVISMVERRDAPSYGSFGIQEQEATIPSARDTIMREVGPAMSANHTQTIESGPLQLSSLRESTTEMRGLMILRTEPANPRDTILKSPDQTGADTYSLLEEGSLPGSLLYRYQENDAASAQWIGDDESFAREISQAPRPLLQLGFGDWRLPVTLSSTTVAR